MTLKQQLHASESKLESFIYEIINSEDIKSTLPLTFTDEFNMQKGNISMYKGHNKGVILYYYSTIISI